jgi:hypothetical protein
MNQRRYQDYLDELALGSTYGIFVDDTGSPGLANTPSNLHPDRKTWVAVVVPPNIMPEILDQLPHALQGLQELVGADEFHFADICAGRRQFKDVDLDVRLALFEFMTYIFVTYRFPVIIQTFDPTTLDSIRSQSDGVLPDQIPPFDFHRHEDCALFFLLVRLKWFMEGTPTYPSVKARVFIDEGYKGNGIGIALPAFKSVFTDGLICFARSSSIVPIQLADFAAFALNRAQLIGGKPKRNRLDHRVLEILSPLSFNYQNIEKRTLSLGDDGPLIPPQPMQ